MTEQPSIFKEIKYWEVDYSDLEELIQKQYNVPFWDIVLSEEWHNDSSHPMNIQKEEDGRYTQEAVEKLIANRDIDRPENMFILDHLMTDLCNRGIILPGNYLITVMW